MHLDIVAAIVIVVLLIYATMRTEHFDTYRNHDFGAYEVYKSPTGSSFGNPPETIRTVDQAAQLARYTWSQKDPAGYDVYDRMYDAVVRGTLNNGDPGYSYRDISPGTDGVYDSKFSLMDGNYFSGYNKFDMFDPMLVQTNFNGQQIVLSQKQF